MSELTKCRGCGCQLASPVYYSQDYLSLQALYIAKLGEVQGHEQDRAKVQAALGNGANEDLWQPGTSWVDAAIRAIQHYENHIQC